MMNKNLPTIPSNMIQLYQRAQQMAVGKSEQELEQTARNICRERGISYDYARNVFNSFFNNINQNKGVMSK